MRMGIRVICLQASTVLTLLLTTSLLQAQVPFSVAIDKPVRTLDTVSFTTFEIHVTNTTGDTIRVRATRAVNGLPDSAWESSICSITTCYPPEVDVTEYEQARPEGMTGFAVHVMTGPRHGDSARIVLSIDTGPGSESVVRELVVKTAAPPAQIFRVEPEQLSKSIAVGETAEFLIWGYNYASDSLSLAVVRVEDYFTSEGWESSICVEDDCSSPDVDAPPAIVLQTDKATWFKLRVRAGSVGSGDVVLRFNTMRGTDPIEKRFTVTAGVSAVHDDVRGASSAQMDLR